jgi:hypothetical protein
MAGSLQSPQQQIRLRHGIGARAEHLVRATVHARPLHSGEILGEAACMTRMPASAPRDTPMATGYVGFAGSAEQRIAATSFILS